MRIIAGTARGQTLQPPPDPTRPTMDRVRAAIFSSLGDAVPEARVLDLFAGSGGLGIEALSRGAASAVFVDMNPRCTQCVRANLRKTSLQALSIQTLDVFRFLDLYTPPNSFDLIFADPPYAKREGDRDFAAELLAHPSLGPALSPTGTFVLECHPSQLVENPPGFALLKVKEYGETAVAYYVAEASCD